MEFGPSVVADHVERYVKRARTSQSESEQGCLSITWVGAFSLDESQTCSVPNSDLTDLIYILNLSLS